MKNTPLSGSKILRFYTDNGRQYTNWRGKTRFEQELEKDRVKHIRSRPHHPMTLGKIERFWKSILEEFLQRVQFDSFDEAVERTALWVKYYNHKRPHQGIGGFVLRTVSSRSPMS